MYKIVSELGNGTFGRCFKVEKDNKFYVLKKINLRGLSEKDKKETLNEVKILSQCNHFNIIKYYESFIENDYLNIITEYAEGGDLALKIKNQNNIPFSEDVLWNYLIQIANGLKYLRDKRILHRDIKPQNIYLDSEENIKIGDMGFGKLVTNNSLQKSVVGTPLYFSPELCNEQPYSFKSDIWAFGCLMYELATFKPPFIASNQIALAKKICNEQPNPIPKFYSIELQFLIFKMLEKDVKKRPDINHILEYSAVKIRVIIFIKIL